MKNPRVSVIFPVYNAGKFIREAIQSTLDQTFGDFELILIDDGSTDDSLKKIIQFADPRIRLFRNEKNEGLIFALNKGISEAKGEFLARMDADDISFPQRFDKQVHFLEHHSDIGVCGTLMKVIPSGNIYKHRFLQPELVKAALVFTNPIVHPSVMMRRNLFVGKELFYNKSYPHGEDYALWISLLNRTKFCVLPEALISYRAHSEQISRTFNETQRESVKKAQQMIFELLGIEASEKERQIHVTLFLEDYQKETTYAAAVEKWLLKLSNANAKEKIFDKDAFGKVIGEWWFRVNQELSVSGLGSYAQFKKSILSRGFQPSVKSIAKLRLKSILKSEKKD